MRDAARVMEAALERIASTASASGIAVDMRHVNATALWEELCARALIARAALAEVRALPASDIGTSMHAALYDLVRGIEVWQAGGSWPAVALARADTALRLRRGEEASE